VLEVLVHHEVDSAKARDLERVGIPWVEIDGRAAKIPDVLVVTQDANLNAVNCLSCKIVERARAQLRKDLATLAQVRDQKIWYQHRFAATDGNFFLSDLSFEVRNCGRKGGPADFIYDCTECDFLLGYTEMALRVRGIRPGEAVGPALMKCGYRSRKRRTDFPKLRAEFDSEAERIRNEYDEIDEELNGEYGET
jgi:hypothetical protein